MSKAAKGFNPADFESRGSDGWFYAVGLDGGEVVRLGDMDNPGSVLARIKAAKEAKTPGDGMVEFSGCRPKALEEGQDQSKLPVIGWGCYPAQRITSIRSWDSAVLGAAGIEERLSEAEAGVSEHDERLDKLEADFKAAVEMSEEPEQEQAPAPAGQPAILAAPDGDEDDE